MHSNLIMNVISKEPLRQKLQLDYEAFKQSGGEPTILKPGESAEYKPMSDEELADIRKQIETRRQKKREQEKINKKKRRKIECGPNLIDQEFGSLTVKRRDVDSSGRKAWVCVCECGEETRPIITSHLTGKKRTHCGCKGGFSIAVSKHKYGRE